MKGKKTKIAGRRDEQKRMYLSCEVSVAHNRVSTWRKFIINKLSSYRAYTC